MPKELIIGVDTRERSPVPFPANLITCTEIGVRSVYKLRLEPIALPCADYVLLNKSGKVIPSCGIERKGSLRELVGCLLGRDSQRFSGPGGQLERLSATYKRPVLLLELSPRDLHAKMPPPHSPASVRGMLHHCCARHGVECLLAGSYTRKNSRREQVGELIANHLFAQWRANR